jgi:hypothetical protein
MIFTMLDVQIDENGNMSPGPGDIKLAGTVDSIGKIIEWRLKTSPYEWNLYDPFVAADLPSFVGRKNDPDTGEEIKAAVYRALTSDGFIPTSDLFVDVVPTSVEDILVNIQINNLIAPDVPESQVNFYYQFDLSAGKITSIAGGTY